MNPCSGELCNNASPIFPDLYCNIIPDQPDSPWVAAFTYIRAAIGFCYLAVILDSCSRKVMGMRCRGTCVTGWSPSAFTS
ncbi:hypothetical protein GCM10011402_28230 [Paracoccus acridae]|uniref:Uncharacterized protein n=1 Tax=Paracoccus acridae TaxID=1795310 RepID=A0ABQ1VLN3_9RHOB|nr:hypothetical protein GCM10011402_28230 [Paracoccus acridae]